MSLPAANWTTGEVPTAAKMNAQIRDNWDAGFPTDSFASASWTPALSATSVPPSTSSTTGAQWRVGPEQSIWVRWVISSVDAGAGTFFVMLPVASSGVTATTPLGQAVGWWIAYDSSASGNSESGTAYLRSSTTMGFWRPIGANVTDTTPFAWASGDILTVGAKYPVA